MRAMKQLLSFVENLPYDKLEGFPPNAEPGTIHKYPSVRLDLQGMTSNHDWNLQIQINHECKITCLRAIAPDTIAGPVIVNHKASQTPAEIRALFKDKIMRNAGPNIPAQPHRSKPNDEMMKKRRK